MKTSLLKNYVFSLVLLILTFESIAQNSILINSNAENQTIVAVDLFRICSSISANNPNHQLTIINNEINLTISVTRGLELSVPCDPVPPTINNYAYFNIGTLHSGEYRLNLSFVGNSEPPNPSNAVLVFPFIQPFTFFIASPIPSLNWIGILFLFIIIIIHTSKKYRY